VELYLLSSSTPSWRGAQLKKSAGTTLPLLIDRRLNGHKGMSVAASCSRRDAQSALAACILFVYTVLRQECMELYLRSPVCFHGVVLS
jgi:hypothetical protein